MADEIRYNYPTDYLDQLIEQIQSGITPMLTPDLRAEIELRQKQIEHELFEDDDDESYHEALQKHDAVMKKIEEKRRRSHSRNIVILDLTDEEQQELHDGMETMYVRSDPNSMYNISEEDLTADEEKREIYRKLQSLGKAYYHQEDYRNAINIICEAIEYSLKHDYPWLTYEEALEELKAGRIRYAYSQLPILYMNYNTQITDPKILSGVVTGEVQLIDKDDEPVRKKRKKDVKAVEMEYTVIGPEEHAEYVKMHQAGIDTPISPILKSCSTIYNRYVMPTTSWFNQSKPETMQPIDWSIPGSGAEYFNAVHGIKPNVVSDVVSLLQEHNGRKLNQKIGTGLREFPQLFSPTTESPKFVLSTSLEQNEKAVEIESRILDMIRQSNPNL